jgi:hypothetical protein
MALIDNNGKIGSRERPDRPNPWRGVARADQLAEAPH